VTTAINTKKEEPWRILSLIFPEGEADNIFMFGRFKGIWLSESRLVGLV